MKANVRPLTTLLLILAPLPALGGCAVPTGGTVGSPPPVSESVTRATQTASAVALADGVMERMGGQAAWDRTRYITFTFFGNRRHLWDKHTGDIRIEGTDRESGEPYLVLMNLHTGQGGAWKRGEPVVNLAEAQSMLEQGRRAWINDTYWLVMPYKLRDPGVTLRHLGHRVMEDGRDADVLEVTFTMTGVTPENKYHVYVARDTGLVEQWDFYATAEQSEPRFKMPWRDWRRHGEILLSGDRGPQAQLTNIAVLTDVPRATFTNPDSPVPSVP